MVFNIKEKGLINQGILLAKKRLTHALPAFQCLLFQ
jgi:hypothetical protein